MTAAIKPGWREPSTILQAGKSDRTVFASQKLAQAPAKNARAAPRISGAMESKSPSRSRRSGTRSPKFRIDPCQPGLYHLRGIMFGKRSGGLIGKTQPHFHIAPAGSRGQPSGRSARRLHWGYTGLRPVYNKGLDLDRKPLKSISFVSFKRAIGSTIPSAHRKRRPRHNWNWGSLDLESRTARQGR
jgi:hypothetical protein